MIQDPYPFFEFKPSTHYFFESTGEKGSVYKIVTLSLMSNGNWNLGFGDLVKGEISDSVITNNNDVRKVIGTVAKIAINFLIQFPHCTIEIKPVDDKRKALYNTVFQRYFDDIDMLCKITGLIRGKKEPYLRTKTYDTFTIKLKS
jgi:hypothetical protein